MGNDTVNGYIIRRSVLFKDGHGFAIGENPKAPAPFATWEFAEKDGKRDYYWGHYHNGPKTTEIDFLERGRKYQEIYHVDEVESVPQETYKYYAVHRPISVGTYPLSYFNKPVHMEFYPARNPVEGEAFQAWGEIIYAQPLTEDEMQAYELKPSRKNADMRERMERQTQAVGKWEKAKRIPESKRFTWYCSDFGCYVLKEFVTPEQLSERVRIAERQAEARRRKLQKKERGQDSR